MAGTSKEAEAMKQLALPVLRQRSPDFPSHALEVRAYPNNSQLRDFRMFYKSPARLRLRRPL